MKSKKRDMMRTKILENIKKARILIDGSKLITFYLKLIPFFILGNSEISTRGTTLTPPNREVL